MDVMLVVLMDVSVSEFASRVVLFGNVSIVIITLLLACLLGWFSVFYDTFTTACVFNVQCSMFNVMDDATTNIDG